MRRNAKKLRLQFLFRCDGLVDSLDLLDDCRGIPQNFCLPVLIGAGHTQQDAGKARHPVPVLRWEISASVKRDLSRSQKNSQRPSALAGDQLDRVHVDGVEVRPLLAVHLDADKVVVHDARNVFVFERLALHHMTPVAGGIADAQQYGLVLFPSALERLLAPGIPLDRIVRVLAEIGACFVDQFIGVLIHLPSIC